MNTPAHVVLNALVLGRGERERLWLPITLGAVLPDLPMVVFYAYQRLVALVPERVIWSQLYFESRWQAFFDLFNSLPLIALGYALAWRARGAAWMALFASMGLHCLLDLPLHREDAHAHFFPLSSWHFVSPVSYWDPSFYGRVIAGAELALLLLGAGVLWRRAPAWRVVGLLTLSVHGAFVGFAIATWL